MADKKNRVPVREQAPEVRAKNFEEVCYGYNQEEAMEEAKRISKDPNTKRYASFSEALEEID